MKKELMLIYVVFLTLISNILLGQDQRDSLLFQDLNIYRPGTEFIFDAYLRNSKGDTLTYEEIIIHPTGKVWGSDPQAELLYLFTFTKEDSVKYAQKRRNQYSDNWIRIRSEGFVEWNNMFIWMHPIRVNQYYLTQLSPYPEMQLPPEIGKEWDNILTGQDSGMKLVNKYKVSGFETRKYSFGYLFSCWKINAVATLPNGHENKVEFYFNEKYGFTEYHYLSHEGERIDFILKSYREIVNHKAN
ncbi:MAG: hypothetical protein JKY33_03160 [Bacteroidia bacterium]|nr:hypothetical protein [Bacteroidia bacterium]